MESLKNNKISILLIYINMLFVFKIMEKSYLINDFDYGFTFVLMLVGTAVYWLYERVLKKGTHKAAFTLLMIVGAAGAYFYKTQYIKNIIKEQIIDNLNSIGDLTYNILPTYFYQYRYTLAVLIPLATILIILITNRGWLNSILFIVLSYMLMMWYLGYTEEIKKFLLYYVFINVITYSANTYLKSRKNLNKRGVKVSIDHKRIAAYLIVASILITGTISFLPQEYKGKYNIDWQTKWNNKFGQSSAVFKPASEYLYNISNSGYDSGTKKLGGPITVDDDWALKIKSDKPYYLKGVVKDYYDGFTWSISDNSYKLKQDKEQKIFNDSFSTVHMGTENSITVYPAGIRTSTYFLPNYTFNVTSEKDKIFYNEVPTFVSSSSIDQPYTVKFYNLKDNVPLISDDSYWSKIGLGMQVPKQFYESNYRKYLQVPDNISPDIYEKVYEITKGCRTNYERVKKIQDYLSKNYPYSLDVTNVPEGHEFIDYFLNVEKKGYCTYFATTATIFCRIAGIPARYIEGFNMTERKNSDGLYLVTDSNAHAWTEVLLMANEQNGLWATLDCVPNAPVEVLKRNEEDTPTNNPNTNPSTNPNKKPTNPNDPDNNSNTETGRKMSVWVVTGIASAVVFIVGLISIFAVFLLKKRKIMKCESLIPLYNYSLRRLKSINIKKPAQLGDKEFAAAISDDELRKNLSELVDICYAEFYGKKTGFEFNREQYYEFVEQYVIRRGNRFKYWASKYFKLW